MRRKKAQKIQNRTIKLFSNIAKILAPPPKLTVSEWADRYRRLSSEAKSITYEERVQTSSFSCGYAEKESIRQITKLEEERKYVRRKLLKKRARISELERQIAPLKFNLSMLSKENKMFIEWKYRECKSVGWISIEMYAGARATAYRKREELVEDIAHWCNFTK